MVTYLCTSLKIGEMLCIVGYGCVDSKPKPDKENPGIRKVDLYTNR